MEKQKKNIGLYILKILKEYSDEQHPISQTEITKRLKEYGIESIDRGTISNHIDMLNEFGYTIIKKIGGGCYFVNEGLDSSELTFLVDSIFSSPAISQKQAQDLVDRITAESSKYERQRFKNIFKTEELIRTDNRQVFYNIDQINYAIQNNKQIIIASDRSPKDMSALEERLRSRFSSGLIQDIQEPDYETKVAIIKKKCSQEGYLVDDDVVDFIFDYKMKITKKTFFLGLITPLLYFAFVMICTVTGIRFYKEGFVPYFFLDYKQYGWFTLSTDIFGVFYWIILQIILVLFISFFLIFFLKKRKKNT